MVIKEKEEILKKLEILKKEKEEILHKKTEFIKNKEKEINIFILNKFKKYFKEGISSIEGIIGIIDDVLLEKDLFYIINKVKESWVEINNKDILISKKYSQEMGYLNTLSLVFIFFLIIIFLSLLLLILSGSFSGISLFMAILIDLVIFLWIWKIGYEIYSIRLEQCPKNTGISFENIPESIKKIAYKVWEKIDNDDNYLDNISKNKDRELLEIIKNLYEIHLKSKKNKYKINNLMRKVNSFIDNIEKNIEELEKQLIEKNIEDLFTMKIYKKQIIDWKEMEEIEKKRKEIIWEDILSTINLIKETFDNIEKLKRKKEKILKELSL